MKTSLARIIAKTTLLLDFEAKYQPGDRPHSVHSVDTSDAPPGVCYSGATEREWVVTTFGSDDWQTSYQSDGWQHVCKVVDGVKVTMYRAYRAKCSMPRAVNPALLLGEEVLA